jgi:hypothetical protein
MRAGRGAGRTLRQQATGLSGDFTPRPASYQDNLHCEERVAGSIAGDLEARGGSTQRVANRRVALIGTDSQQRAA